MKIAFLDAAVHLRTKSSHFFVELLGKLGPVSVFHVNLHELSVLAEVVHSNFDLVVLWQNEQFAPYFLACGKKTIVVPMYDGCAAADDLYWHSMRGARIIDFCQKLHRRHVHLGLASLYVQYFPDPAGITPVEDFSSLRGFLWQRRPQQRIDWRLIYALVPHGLESLHVHLVSDEGFNELPPPNVTVSEWAEDNAAYRRMLAGANVFFASRRTEGIGMGTLEAMTMGMCVVAYDEATANEYLIDRQNGRLFSLPAKEGGTVMSLNLTARDAKRLGQSARETVERGRERFLASVDNLLAYIASTPAPAPDYGQGAEEEEFLRLGRLYTHDLRRHGRRLRQLHRRGFFTDDLPDRPLTDRIWHNLRRWGFPF
jgi:hypothetical protein